MTLLLGVAAGLAIGTLLGLLGAGGSILAVPVLAHLFGQDAHTATTGSLVVVAVAAAIGAAAARRQGTVLLARGLAFGTVATAGSFVGSSLAHRLPEEQLTWAFSGLLVVVALALLAGPRGGEPSGDWAEPILTLSPRLGCACPRALKIPVTATGVGTVTGLFGVGAGFLAAPALVLALGVPAAIAVGTSLVAIAVTSTGALAVRLALGFEVAWLPVLLLTAAAALSAPVAARQAARVPRRLLVPGFAGILLAIAGAGAWSTT
ncbi:sulfite exporter TauE/SafE family protein [Nocardioides daejeonensis]|uniref:sulfite exporter TauE/SafE family protein n=1 Tax=Nocardioides daejeonensis TaxID=1046556 RepID=UPI000D748433|nr:sulfite exporter TauE/SafE family protein [Nocardioides daejeonensis]